MIKSFLTVEQELTQNQDLSAKGIWINLINPSEEEVTLVSNEAKIDTELIRAALDEEERSRLEVEENQVLILIDVPISGGENGNNFYETVPFGIIVTDTTILTVCLKENPIFNEFENSKQRSFFTYKKTRFVLQLLFTTAAHYLRYLKQIDKKTGEIEKQLHKSMKNEELFQLLNLGKSLVYFTTSLRANQIVMEKLLRSQWKSASPKVDPDTVITSQILKMYPDDEDLLEDVITENKQAIEMSETYTNILNGMMDAFASVISNNLNMVMKLLASVTIILALPTMVASFFGMNVAIPFQKSPHAFTFTITISIILSLVGFILLRRKNMI